MSTMSMTSSSRWTVDSRVIVYAAIGAALYAVLGLFSFILPGTSDVQIRPAFALVTFFGYAFGPIVGLFAGFVGNAVIDQIQGSGLLTYWN
ncbi:MAG TPA: ECF transporter S component, partial [Candidatus Limnocylindrales bacterium]|nr:ECF transporter S component [Candidatus Limnocylindrales bacterium]